MGWSIGYDENWKRDVGYGVPAQCDHPGCHAVIDRGLSYVCGGDVFGGEYGCGLYFCGKHLWLSERRPQRCARCKKSRFGNPFKPKPDVASWIQHKLTDPSWADWRTRNAAEVEKMQSLIAQQRST